MAASLNHCNTHEFNCKVNCPLTDSLNSGATGQSQPMEVKGYVVTPTVLAAPDHPSCVDSQLAERVLKLQERQRSLQALLESRLGELRWICLLEAELTGQLPSEFPLGEGERPPAVRNKMAQPYCVPAHTAKEEEEVCPRTQKKGLLSGGLRRQKEAQQHQSHSKRMVHRGCHTDEVVKTDSTSVLNCTNQDNGEWSPSPSQEHQSPCGPCPAPGSPDKRLSRKLSPGEVYSDMRPRRSSVASSDSPSQSLSHSTSNMEGRSVPATPLLTRPVLSSVHWRSEVLGGPGAEWTTDGLVFLQSVPAQPRGEASFVTSAERGGAKARRSTSSEALLDRSAYTEEGRRRAGMPPRGGPYRSSEALTDGRSRRGANEAAVGQAKGRLPGGGHVAGGSHSASLTECVWGRRPKAQAQPHRQRHPSGGPESRSSPGSSPSVPTPPADVPAAGPPPHSPPLSRSQSGELRRTKVTRTKSCGPLLSQHQQGVLMPLGHTDVSLTNTPLTRRPPRFPHPGAEGPARGLHKALALEGLREWYLRNTLGHSAGLAAGLPRRQMPSLHGSHPHPLTHQPQSLPSEQAYLHLHNPQVHLSATFHGHPLHGRSLEFSLYQDLDPSSDSPAPGTLV